MDFLVRLAQAHESFRRAELEALATLAGVELQIVSYEAHSPFCIVRVPSANDAKALVSRAILAQGIYSLWGSGTDYDTLHADVKARTSHLWESFKNDSFKFVVQTFQGKRSTSQQREIINSFSYVGFAGPIRMTDPQHEFVVFEDYALNASKPRNLYLGRFVGRSDREAINRYDLKKRAYISTTSMDAELALVTANMALASPGKIFFDPFMGTGGFPLACAHFGAHVMGSDIDGRSIRGKGGRKSVLGNFKQYALTGRYLNAWTSDLTNTPLRIRQCGNGERRGTLDGIVCDPPYGVREGLKVLGRKDGGGKEPIMIDGQLAHTLDGFIYPKRPYSFTAMLEDILDFAAIMLVEGGRLSMWMPTANEDDQELSIPKHPCLTLSSNCIQPFNRWSRRLLTYQRRPDVEVGQWTPKERQEIKGREYANDLNDFRKKYFEGFREHDLT